MQLGVWDLLKGLGSSGVFDAQIYAFSLTLVTLFLSYLTPSTIAKTDKNRTLHCTPINLIYFYAIITHLTKNCIF